MLTADARDRRGDRQVSAQSRHCTRRSITETNPYPDFRNVQLHAQFADTRVEPPICAGPIGQHLPVILADL